MKKQTKELKAATQIENLTNDLTLDLEQVGVYLAGSQNVTYRRVMEIMETAKYEREEKESFGSDLF